MLRDLTGQTFFKQRIAQFTFAFAGLKAMLRGEAAQKTGASTKAGPPFNKQSDDGMTSPTIDVAGALAVARAVGRFLLVQAVLLGASLTPYDWTPSLLWLPGPAPTFQLSLPHRNIAAHPSPPPGRRA